MSDRQDRALKMLDPKAKGYSRLLQKIDILQVFLDEQDKEIERLQEEINGLELRVEDNYYG